MKPKKKKTQRNLASRVMISEAFLSQIVNGTRRPSWNMAKKLAAITRTRPELWLEGDPEHLKHIARSK